MTNDIKSYIANKIGQEEKVETKRKYSADFLDKAINFIVQSNLEDKNIITTATVLHKGKVVQSRRKGRDLILELINKGYIEILSPNITELSAIKYNSKFIKKGKIEKSVDDKNIVFVDDSDKKTKIIFDKGSSHVYNNEEAYFVYLPSSKQSIITQNGIYVVSRYKQVFAMLEDKTDDLVALSPNSEIVCGRVGYNDVGQLVLYPYQNYLTPIRIEKILVDKDNNALVNKIGVVKVSSNDKDIVEPIGQLLEVKDLELKKEAEFIANLYTNPYNIFDTSKEIKKIQEEYKRLLKEYQEKAVPFDDSVWSEPDRNNKIYDFTNLFSHTIDPENAQDLDDAVYSYIDSDGNFVTISHITNIPLFVQKNSNIDLSALDKGETTYFPCSGSKPMIDKELTNNEFSLLQDGKRIVFSLIRKIDFRTGRKVGDDKVVLGLIESKGKYSYPDISARLKELKENGQYYDIKKMILQAKSQKVKLHPQNKDEAIVFDDMATGALWKELNKNGMINFISQDEFSFKMDEQGHVSSMKIRERYDSCKMIEAYALTGNNVVADFLIRNNLPGIFRVHDEPEEKSLIQLQETLSSLYNINLPLDNFASSVNKIMNKYKYDDNIGSISENIIKSLKRAEYSTEVKPHMATGMDDYVHFTSGIRRYADVINQRIVLDFLQGRQCEYIESELKQDANHINERAEQVDEVHKMLNDLYMADYARNFVGKTVVAKVSEFDETDVILKTKEGMEIFVPIDNFVGDDNYHFTTYGKALVSSKTMMKQGDVFNIVITGVDLTSRQITGESERQVKKSVQEKIIESLERHEIRKYKNEKRKRIKNKNKERKRRDLLEKESMEWE